MKFKATRAPRGRLVRLGVVLDTRNSPRRVQEVARMCDGAGLDALWVRDHLAPVDGEPRLEAWTALCLASQATTRARVGAHLTIAFRPPSTLAAMAGTLDAAIGGRLELGLSAGWVAREHLTFGFDFPDEETRASRLERYARILRGLLARDTVAVSVAHDAGEAELGVASPQPGGPPISVEALSPLQMAIAARVADDVVVPAERASDIEAIAGQVRAACVEA